MEKICGFGEKNLFNYCFNIFWWESLDGNCFGGKKTYIGNVLVGNFVSIIG